MVAGHTDDCRRDEHGPSARAMPAAVDASPGLKELLIKVPAN